MSYTDTILSTAFGVFTRNAVMVYGFVLIITLSHTLSFVMVGTLFALLFYFRLPPVNALVADEMLQVGKPSIIAHRGGSLDAPENTIGAIRKAKENGADGVEFDVSYTADGVAVLMHDDAVDRTTNGTGKINSLSWKYVRTLNAACKKGLPSPDYPCESVPTLEEAVEVCLNLGLRMYIDCKSNGKKLAKEMSALYKKHPKMYNMALVCSFFPHVIYMVRKADPGIVTALIHRPWFMTRSYPEGEFYPLPWWELALLVPLDFLITWAHPSFLWFLCGNAAFSLRKDGCNWQVVSYFRSLKIDIIVWTVNNPIEKAYFTRLLGCDIITDTLCNKNIEFTDSADNGIL